MMFQDARNAQILFLSIFFLLGIGTRDWTLRLDFILILGLSCFFTQWFCSSISSFYINRKFTLLSPEFLASWRSALITTLGLCLLLRANHWTTLVIAGCCAIASKFIFQSQGKHFFNPANFGIIIALTLTGDAWVSPGQWGADSWYLLLFLGTAGIILKKVGRWDTSAAFLITYMVLEAGRNFSLGWGWDVYTHQLMNGSLLLFTFFMITDPRSIPNATWGRIIWAVSIAGLTFILQHQFFISTALFWALFALSPLTLVLDAIFQNHRFSWSKKSLKYSASPASL